MSYERCMALFSSINRRLCHFNSITKDFLSTNKMDALTEAMATSFQVTQTPNNPHAPHPRFSQYKVKHKNSDQQTRRERLLEEQKRRRDKLVNTRRNVNEEEEEKEEEEPMQWKQSKQTKKKIKRDRLMLSEWLVEVPTDLAENWYFMLCPVGRRCLVTTNRGQTSAHTRGGYFLKQFSSHLPGGSKRKQMKGGYGYTSLDCVFSEIERTFYVLDVKCWKGNPVTDSETEFRFYWLNDKLSEIPEISQITSTNQFRFVPLQYFRYSASELHRVMCAAAQFEVDLDGILFYHKETHYTCGSTPLVNWLKAYMLPEVLNVEVMEKYMAARPADFEQMTKLREKKSKLAKMDL